MNKYGSALRSITARNILTGTISPALTVVMNQGTYRQVFHSLRFDNNVESNFLVHGVGLYSNYGRGLVLQDPSPRLLLSLRTAEINSVNVLTGTASQTGNAVIGVGTLFTTELSVGDAVYFSSGGARLQFVQSIADNLNMVLSDYQTIAAGSALNQAVYTDRLILGALFDIDIINMQYQLEKYAPQALTSPGLPSFCYAELVVSGDITYLTTSINQGFAGQPVFVDAIADFEITPQ